MVFPIVGDKTCSSAASSELEFAPAAEVKGGGRGGCGESSRSSSSSGESVAVGGG